MKFLSFAELSHLCSEFHVLNKILVLLFVSFSDIPLQLPLRIFVTLSLFVFHSLWVLKFKAMTCNTVISKPSKNRKKNLSQEALRIERATFSMASCKFDIFGIRLWNVPSSSNDNVTRTNYMGMNNVLFDVMISHGATRSVSFPLSLLESIHAMYVVYCLFCTYVEIVLFSLCNMKQSAKLLIIGGTFGEPTLILFQYITLLWKNIRL